MNTNAMSISPPYDAMLTLAIPVSLEEDVLDFLLLHPALARGFSIVNAEGLGQGASLMTTMEKVQGRSRRKLVFVVGHQNELAQLISLLAAEIRNSDVAYWVTPVMTFGRLV